MMEGCIQPLNFKTKFTKTEIEAKGLELKVSNIVKVKKYTNIISADLKINL